MGGQIDLYRSVGGLFELLSTGTFFSRSMILFLSLVGQRSSGPVDSSQFDAFMATYSKSQALVTFPEGTFPEFQPFQHQLSQLTYQYLCTYVNCDPDFASEVNIIYSTTIQKVLATAVGVKGQLNNMTAGALGAAVRNGSLTRFVDLVYYSELTIRGQLVALTSLYFSCFAQYSNNLMLKKEVLAAVALAATLLALLLLAALAAFVVRHQGYLRDIAGLLKTDSYINEDNLIADREAGKAPQ